LAIQSKLFFLENKFCTNKKLVRFARDLKKGAIAQLVEQRTENPCVRGSIPRGTTSKS
jgi:hypothetical protein